MNYYIKINSSIYNPFDQNSSTKYIQFDFQFDFQFDQIYLLINYTKSRCFVTINSKFERCALPQLRQSVKVRQSENATKFEKKSPYLFDIIQYLTSKKLGYLKKNCGLLRVSELYWSSLVQEFERPSFSSQKLYPLCLAKWLFGFSQAIL